MKQHYINKLNSTLQSKFQWNKARVKFLTRFVSSLILSATVKLNRIALMMNTEVKSETNYRGLQRFFQQFKMDYEEFAGFVISLLPSKEKYYLVMDRTNWKFGETNINILMLGIIYKKICFPLYWNLLDKRGSSSTQERKELLQKAIDHIGKERIAGLLGDREFIGVHWFKYLTGQDIEFHIRLPKQVKYGSLLLKHRKTINNLFRFFKENVKIDHPKKVKILGFNLYVSGMRTDKGYCVVVSNKDNLNSLEKYQQRWTIENMFGAFKTRGFNFEDTHMKDLEKIKKLIALVSIVYIWCVLVGLWYDATVPIRLMTLGRKRVSIFRYGFNYLTVFFKKLLDGLIYNDFEFNEVTKLLSCT
jgi:hypothetical protein